MLDDLDRGCAAGCCPPSTGKTVLLGAASVVLFLVLFFLLVRLVERAFIRSERSPLLGRHLGISMSLLTGSLGGIGIFYFGTGCWIAAFTYWAGFAVAVWLLHLVYTLVAIRR